ncbi:hypothetical protein [Streptomyces sp. PSKA30]|uniref:hypothetical protein n=1 Tax=Streptomyces sp. PSKA30 TaxID=2874597 RepID=UPI001CD0984D|nr:hypothetical protein [Streptomyces sp. PSKA30]MBZ9642345.1 hypothetical protein [Streptomyces sp. PSKA30]
MAHRRQAARAPRGVRVVANALDVAGWCCSPMYRRALRLAVRYEATVLVAAINEWL